VNAFFTVRPLPFTWPFAPVYWLVFLWAFLPEFALIQRSQARVARTDSPDAGSMRVILIGNQLASFAGFWVAGLGAMAVPTDWRVPLFVAGLLLLIAGSLLRRHCWRVLGQSFTGDVSVRADQPVIDRGAYRWVRHPSYTGGMLMFGGAGLALGNWLSVALMLGTTILAYVYRVHVEERAMLAAIGEPYRRFMQTRKRFIPFLI